MMASEGSKSHGIRMFIRVFVLLVLIILEMVLLFFAGIAYFQLVFWIFLLMSTSIPFVPQLAKVLTGAELSETVRTKLLRRRESKSYKAFWLGINIFHLAVLLLLFKYNIRLVDYF